MTSGLASRLRKATGYLPIEDYGLIGNMRTCALVGTDGGLDYMCWPEFDSPSLFCRILDKDKGGHFSIAPIEDNHVTLKQQYVPASNILQTRFISEQGVINLVDFFPRPRTAPPSVPVTGMRTAQYVAKHKLKEWLVRRVECVRGGLDLLVEIFPAFDYARAGHRTELLKRKDPYSTAAIFRSDKHDMQLDVTIDCGDAEDAVSCPQVLFRKETREKMLGPGVVATLRLEEGQAVSFILQDCTPEKSDERLTSEIMDRAEQDTQCYWSDWIGQSTYKGRFREVVERSLMLLKMLTYEPTGAIIAAPTFSLPEDFGGSRNWDYRFSWVRDSSFTIYILLRMGFKSEAEAYMNFISARLQHSRTAEGGLPIMFTIRGDTELDETELTHLDGYRGSKPVRIGNGAAFHVQLDIYGELMDAIYLYNKYGKPVSWDQWVAVRHLTDYVCGIWKERDMSIWEVRSRKQNYVYSKIMLWVAVDRALRLAEKRCLPCPHRLQWMAVRDEIYEGVMTDGYNQEMGCFIQSYESREVLDSAVLIAPLVFFIAPNDPRFLSTLDQILKPPEKGGLTSTGLVYRYNHLKAEDGVGGREGSFSMCTFWLVEALTRAGQYDKRYLLKATDIFENMLSFSNHLSMFSEEIARSGEQLGNTPQAFSHLALISAAFNLDRTAR
ncbi:MAG: hypothetical protein M1826_005739 [Phylliscum demangeonii]|nr:MAG: hypothetical protein M1826_005739 [Phylliscum demangeonii]